MYTQCSHCRAVFRVTMKELTAAQGLLRCGECDTIFDAMKALSTTLPEERGNSPADHGGDTDARKVLPLTQAAGGQARQAAARTGKPAKAATAKKTSRSRKFLYLSLIALSLILLLQLLYSARGWLMEHPATSRVTQNWCELVGCKVEATRSLERIKMLSHNVYTHPNSPNVLIINTSIQNNAEFAQPYPLLEISFLNQNSEVVALRRFTPDEYLGPAKDEKLMPQGTPKEFSLNIADPGKDAIRFQFRFL